MGLPPGGTMLGENVSTTETTKTTNATRSKKFSCLRPIALRDVKKVSADRKSLVKGSLDALLKSFDDDDDEENFLNRKKGGGGGGMRRCHSGGELHSMKKNLMSSNMKMPTLSSSSNMNRMMKRKSADPDMMKSKFDSMKNSTMKIIKPISTASNMFLGGSGGGGGEQQQQQQQQQKVSNDPFVDYLLYMESQKQSQEEYDNMFKRSPGKMIKKIKGGVGVSVNRIANLKRSNSDQGGDKNDSANANANANERRMKSLAPLTGLSDHFKLRRSKSDQEGGDDARSFFSTISSGRKERTTTTTNTTSGGDNRSVSSERLNRRTLDLSKFSSTLSGRAERSVDNGQQYECLDDSKEGFVDEQQQEQEEGDKIDDADDDSGGGFKTPTTRRRRSIGHNDYEDWLGEESTMPLVDNSSEEFRIPATATTSRQGGLSPHSRRQSRSPSAGRSATSSSTIDDSIDEEEEGPQSTGTTSSVVQPPPPPPQSPISFLDDDDWRSVHLEDVDSGTASPSSLSSHKRSISSRQHRSRSRSVGGEADPTEEVAECSSTTKSPSKERRNKSRSPGNHNRKKDRKSTGGSSRNSPGKNRDRKSSSTASPGKHNKDGRMSSSGSSNSSSIVIPPRDICFLNTPTQKTTTTETQSVFDDQVCDDSKAAAGSTDHTNFRDTTTSDYIESSELLQTSPGTLTESKVKKDSRKSKSPKESRDSKKSTKKKKRDKSSKKGDKEDINKKEVDVMCDDFFGDYVTAIAATSPMTSPSKNGSLRRHSFDSLRDFAGDNNIDYSAHCNMMMIDRSVHDDGDDDYVDRERKTTNDSSGDTKSKSKDRKSTKKRSSKKSSTSSKKSVKKSSKGDLSKATSKEVTPKESSGEAALGVLDGAFDDISNDKNLESPITTNRSKNGSFRRHSFDDSIRDIRVIASPRQQHVQIDAALAAVNGDDDNDDSDVESSTNNDEDEDEFALGDETVNDMPPPTRKMMMLSHKGKKKRSIIEDSFRGLSTF